MNKMCYRIEIRCNDDFRDELLDLMLYLSCKDKSSIIRYAVFRLWSELDDKGAFKHEN